MPLLPKASLDYTYIVYLIGVITIIYASISTLRTIGVTFTSLVSNFFPISKKVYAVLIKGFSLALVHIMFTFVLLYFAKTLNVSLLVPFITTLSSYLSVLIMKNLNSDKIITKHDLFLLFIPIFLFGVIKFCIYFYIGPLDITLLDPLFIAVASLFSSFYLTLSHSLGLVSIDVPKGLGFLRSITHRYLLCAARNLDFSSRYILYATGGQQGSSVPTSGPQLAPATASSSGYGGTYYNIQGGLHWDRWLTTLSPTEKKMKTRLANGGVFFLDIHKVIEHTRADLPTIPEIPSDEEVNDISQQPWFRYKFVGDLAKHGDSVNGSMFSDGEKRCVAALLKERNRTDMYRISSDGRTVIGWRRIYRDSALLKSLAAA